MIKKWEYTRVNLDETKLNTWGDKGWELVCIAKDADDIGPWAYLKREKKE